MRSHDNPATQWFEQVWNQGNADAMDRLAAPHMRAHGADGVTRSIAEFKDFQRLMRTAMPDLHLEVTHAVEANSMVAVHWVASGTHSGTTPALGAGTGRRVTVAGLSLIRCEHGKIVEGWDDFDYAGLMTQLSAGV